MNKTGLQPVSRPVEEIVGAKMCLRMFIKLTAPKLKNFRVSISSEPTQGRYYLLSLGELQSGDKSMIF